MARRRDKSVSDCLLKGAVRFVQVTAVMKSAGPEKRLKIRKTVLEPIRLDRIHHLHLKRSKSWGISHMNIVSECEELHMARRMPAAPEPFADGRRFQRQGWGKSIQKAASTPRKTLGVIVP